MPVKVGPHVAGGDILTSNSIQHGLSPCRRRAEASGHCLGKSLSRAMNDRLDRRVGHARRQQARVVHRDEAITHLDDIDGGTGPSFRRHALRDLPDPVHRALAEADRRRAERRYLLCGGRCDGGVVDPPLARLTPIGEI